MVSSKMELLILHFVTVSVDEGITVSTTRLQTRAYRGLYQFEGPFSDIGNEYILFPTQRNRANFT